MRTFIIFLFIFHKALHSEVRFLKPPNLSSEAISRKIVCSRPTRAITPNFSMEEKGDKILIHNYGHSGAGWSLSIGSVQYCCSLLDQSFANLDRSIDLAIIGGGCIGLFTAYHLWNIGFKNITIYANEYEDLTSHRAGGLLSFRTTDLSQINNHLILTMGEETYRFFRSIAEGKNNDFATGAKILPTYFGSFADSELEELVGRGMKSAKEVVVDFGHGVQREMIVYDDSLFIDTGSMMSQLRNYLSSKICFKKQFIDSFDTLSEKIIFNCTGLGARELNQDDHMFPIQGHLIMLQHQIPEELQYMLIASDYSDENQDKRIIRSIDFFPKKQLGSDYNEIGVLGGTFISMDGPLDSNYEFNQIMTRVRAFFYGDATLETIDK